MLVKLIFNVLLLPINLALFVPRLALKLTIMANMKLWITA